MTSFNEWTAKEAAESIPDQNAAWLKMNLAFIAGDHFQKANAYIGPMVDSSHEGYSTMLASTAKSFISQNTIGEITDRHGAGVIGENPQKSRELRRALDEDYEPSTAEDELLAEAGALLSSWWNSKKGVIKRNGRISRVSPHEVFQEAVKSLLVTTRAPLRFVVPAGLLETDGEGIEQVPKGSIADMLAKIHISHPSPEMAAITVDDDTLDEAGVFVKAEENNKQTAEICFVDELGNTIIRLVNDDIEQAIDYPLTLGGRLTMFEMERPLFIDEPKRRLQMALNMARTAENNNLIHAGFLERWLLNARMAGEDVPDETQPSGYRFVPSKMNIGPLTLNSITGIPIRDENDNITGYTTPATFFHEPTPANLFINSSQDFYTALLHEASQMHVLAQSGGGQVSGEFVVQARADFENSLKVTKTTLDAALTWCFDTVLALAAALAGQPGYFDELKISGSAIINSGPLSIGERQAIISAHEKGLISKETAVRMLGAENVSAELESIEAEQVARLQQMKIQAEILEIMGRAGVALPAAVQAVQDGEITDALIRGDFVPEGDGE